MTDILEIRLATLETKVTDHESQCMEHRRLFLKVLAGALAISVTASGFVLDRIIHLTSSVDTHTEQLREVSAQSARQSDQVRSDILDLRADLKHLLEKK